MLPYLDKFLYIGTKLDRMTAELRVENERRAVLEAEALAAPAAAKTSAGDGTAAGGTMSGRRPETDSSQSSARRSPRSARFHGSGIVGSGDTWGEVDRTSSVGGSVSFQLGDEDEMFFHRDAPPFDAAALTSGAVEAQSLASGAISRSSPRRLSSPGTGRWRGREVGVGSEPSSADGIKRLRGSILSTGSSFALPPGGRAVSSARSAVSSAASAVDARVLSSRYVRFWEAAKLGDDALDTDLGAGRARDPPPTVRPLSWLLQVIEDIYDAANEAEHPMKVGFLQVS